MHLKASSCGVAIALYQHILHGPANGSNGGTNAGGGTGGGAVSGICSGGADGIVSAGLDVLTPLNPRHRAIALRKLDESLEIARVLRGTLEALQGKYEEALAARDEKAKALAEAEAAAEVAKAAAKAAAAKVAEAAAAAGEAGCGSRQSAEGTGLCPSHDGVVAVAPGVPPLLSEREITELQADRARNLVQASATRR